MKSIPKNIQYILLITIIGFIWIAFNKTGLIKLYFLKSERLALIKEIEILEQNEYKISEHIKKLDSDLDYIEFLAYSKFQMVKPGEKIYKIKDYKNVNK